LTPASLRVIVFCLSLLFALFPNAPSSLSTFFFLYGFSPRGRTPLFATRVGQRTRLRSMLFFDLFKVDPWTRRRFVVLTGTIMSRF